MSKKLYTINTVNNFMEVIFNPFGKPFAEENPDIQVYNIMDDSLLSDTLKQGCVSPDVAGRMLQYALAAQNSGADGILVTCTSVNEATRYIKEFLRIPIMNIEEPTAQMAVDSGSTIGVLATLPTSPAAIGRVIQQYADKKGKAITIKNAVVDGAFDVLCSGDRTRHDEMVCGALYELAKEVDVIAFAQISMSLLRHDPVSVPLCKIGASGFARIKELMDAPAK